MKRKPQPITIWGSRDPARAKHPEPAKIPNNILRRPLDLPPMRKVKDD